MFQLKFIWQNMKGNRIRYCCALLGTALYSILVLSFSTLSQKIIDEVIMELPQSNFSIEYLIHHLVVLVLCLIGFTLLKTGINYTSIMQYEVCSQRLTDKFRKDLYRNISKQDKTFFDKNRTGDIMTRLTGDMDMVRHTVCWVIRMLLESILTFSLVAGYMLSQDALFTLCLLIITPIILILSKSFSKRVRPMYVDLREKQSELNTAAQENISGNRVVKAFTREDYECEKFDDKNLDYRQQSLKATMAWLKYFPFIDGLCQCLSVVVLVLGGYFMIVGRLSAGTFMAFNSLTWLLSNPMRMLGNLLSDLQKFFASVNKIIELYYSRSTIANRHDAISKDTHLKGNIDFKNVSLKLHNTDVLKNVSFSIKSGQTVAIMGPTGCGKTSLVNLIARLYDATQGEVLIDSVPVGRYDLKTLRGSIGMTTQEVFLFSDTVDSNIAYGDSSMSDEQVRYFADKAAADFIQKMPDQYDTLVGERGTGLSGGQKQRIALARAMAIKPSILVLDDTTSAVDLETEKYIQEGLGKLDFECTKIIIAQRISSTKNADLIMIMDDGKITEIGTHEQLLQTHGYYYDVYTLQYGSPADVKGR